MSLRKVSLLVLPGGATSSMDQTQHNWSAFGGPHGPTPGGMGRKQRKMKSGPSEIAQNFIEYRSEPHRVQVRASYIVRTS